MIQKDVPVCLYLTLVLLKDEELSLLTANNGLLVAARLTRDIAFPYCIDRRWLARSNVNRTKCS